MSRTLGLRPRHGWIVAALAALLTCVAAQTASAASPADGHPYRRGVVPWHVHGSRGGAPLPFNSGNAPAGTRARHAPGRAGTSGSSANLNYGGGTTATGYSQPVGVTTGTPQVYLVFWGSQWGTATSDGQGGVTLSGDPQQIAPDIEGFYRGLGTGGGIGWSGVMTQYCEGVASGSQTCPSTAPHVGSPSRASVLAGVWADTSAAAPSSATGNQLAQEALRAAAHFGNTTAASNRSVQYVVLSPHGTNPDNYESPTTGYCAWHDYSSDSYLSGGAATSSSVTGPVAFTNLPYLTDVGANCGQNFVNSGSAGTLDGVTIVGGHEYAETLTDQFPAGGWTDSSGNENGDKCAWISPGQPGGSGDITLSTGTYAVQTTWGNDGNSGAGACEMSHAIVTSGPTLKFSLASSFTAGQQPTGTVSLADASGNPVNATSDVTVTLTSTRSGAFSPTSVTIPAGSSTSGSFSYGDQKAETTTLTASASGYGSATQTEKVTAGPAASVSVTPASATVGTGGSTVFTAKATDQYGNATSASATAWSTTAPGTVSPATGASTTFTAGSSTGSGNVTATLNGATATASVTVSPQVLLNGGFENAFANWVIGGGKPTPTVVASPVHGGTHSALLGWTSSTGEPNGDSWIQQQITVPAAGATLSFWTWRATTDSINYDWQTCQVRNTSGTTLATIFKTASNARTWQQQTYSLSTWKGQSVVVWCNVHEDGYGDQTYMYVDDFSVA